MLKNLPVLFLFVFLCFSGNAWAQEKPLACPRGTVYKKAKILPGRAEKTDYFEQFEEFCGRRIKPRGFVKHGPYRLWGPNSEVIYQGQFTSGKKSGTWRRWIPTQTVEESWENDKLVESNVVGEPRIVLIDYRACVPQTGGYDWGDGYSSTSYEVLGAQGRFCVVRWSNSDAHNIDPNRERSRDCLYCRVPRSKKKNALTESENALYCQKLIN